ncbi:uncharacterized protein LOC144736842 isoform X2 [Lampetra planeri]
MCVCARGVCVWWSGGTSESDSPLSLVTVTTFVDCGGLKFLLSLLKHHACQGLMLRFESKNTLRFATATLENLSMEPELKSCFHQELAADVLACYLDVPDAPCKLSALRALAFIATEGDLDIICNAQGAVSLLTDMVNRPSYKDYTALENLIYSSKGLVKTLTMISITAGIRRKTEGASSSLDKKVLEELIPKLREKLKVEVEKRDYKLEWGDIAVHPTRRSVQKWPKARDGRIYVPYKVSVAFYDGDVKKIEEAALEFEKKTCVRFIPRSSQTDYIYIHAWDGNWSFLGRQGGDQALSLEPGKVTKGVVLHEFMHALGFHHEHCRSDRDDHVFVLSHNVKPEWVDAIVKTTPHEHNLRTPYDYSSVTHYGMTAGSKDEHSPTLVPKDTSTMRRFGGGHTLSEGDVEKIEKMFGCEPAPRGPSNAAPARTLGASAAYREADVSSPKMTLPRAPEKKEKGTHHGALFRFTEPTGGIHLHVPSAVSAAPFLIGLHCHHCHLRTFTAAWLQPFSLNARDSDNRVTLSLVWWNAPCNPARWGCGVRITQTCEIPTPAWLQPDGSMASPLNPSVWSFECSSCMYVGFL